MGALDHKPFGRFIPKEEVGEAASWEFQSLAGNAAPTGTARLLSDRERRAYERGRKEGFAEGQQAVLAQRQQHGREVARVLEALRARFGELESGGADQVLNLAIAIAQQVVRREIALDRSSVLPALREAVMSIIDQQTQPRVYLHPQDLAFLQEELAADGLFNGCRFFADASVGRSGCRVETTQGEVDATLSTRWQRVLEAIGMQEVAASVPINSDHA